MVKVVLQLPAAIVAFQLVSSDLGNEIWGKPARDLTPDAGLRKASGRFRQFDREPSHGLQDLAHCGAHTVQLLTRKGSRVFDDAYVFLAMHQDLLGSSVDSRLRTAQSRQLL